MTQPKAPQQSKHDEESEVHKGSHAFGFFHRNQKLIIYTAGIFTLLTFSVTGALMSTADRVFGVGFRGAKMTVPGIGEVEVTQQDIDAAKGISQVRASGLRLPVFPMMSFGDEGTVQYIDQLAALHAMAVKLGIDASDDDVETVLQQSLKTWSNVNPNIKTIQHIAFASRTGDVTLFRRWIRSAMRVATFVRLAALGVERTQDAAVAQILDDNEQVSYEVAYVDAKGFKEKLKKDLSDDALKKYLEGLEEVKADRFRKPANKSSVTVALLETAAFKHEAYLGKELDKDLQIGADEIQNRYIRDREDRYKIPKPEKDPEKKDGEGEKPGNAPDGPGKGPGNKDAGGKDAGGKDAGGKDAGGKGPGGKDAGGKDSGGTPPVFPFSQEGKAGGEQNKAEQGSGEKKPDAAKKDAAKKNPAEQDPAKQAGAPKLIGSDQDPKPQAGDANQTPIGTPPNTDPAPEAGGQDEYKLLDDALRAKIKEELFAEKVLQKWQAALDARMAKHMETVIDAEMKAEIAVETAKTAQAEADTELQKKPDDADLKKKVEAAKKAVEAAEAVAKAAKTAVDTRRKGFDFEAAIQELAKGDDGKPRPGLRFVRVGMQDAEGLRAVPELGKWKDSHLPGQMSHAGEVHHGQVQTTEKGAFIFQVTEIEERPFKEFKEIKDELETQYLTEKAEAHSKEKKEAFEKELERLAREKVKDEIAKIEKDGAEAVDKKFNDWKSGLEKKIAADDKSLAGMDPSYRSYKGIVARRDGFKSELEKATEKKKEIQDELDKTTKEEVEKKLAEVHKDVLAAAGKAAGMEVAVLGPYSRRLQQYPRFRENYSNIVQAVFGDAEISDFDVDDTTAVKEDALNEVTFIATCKKVEEASTTNITRKQWLALRNSFAGAQMQKAVNQSFTIDALKAGYKWTEAKPDKKDGAPSLESGKDGKKDAGKKQADDKDAGKKKADDKAPGGKDAGKKGEK